MSSNHLTNFLEEHAPVMVLTGAGISTDSGIPDYRDHEGRWKRKQPVMHQDFMNYRRVRQRYWARSLAGWPAMQRAQPNPAHQALNALEKKGLINRIVTQNVDRLHQRAGSADTIDLHGRADRVICMQCEFEEPRLAMHERCAALNPAFTGLNASMAPDGDADLEADFSTFQISDCPCCGGVLKPDVVFFGDTVPKERVEAVRSTLQQSKALLVVGSSLMVYSGFRFARETKQLGKPLAILTRGRTRADELADLKLDADINQYLRDGG